MGAVMDCKFVVGQRVVCIVKEWHWFTDPIREGPPYGSVCKIVEMEPIIYKGEEDYRVIDGVWLMIEGFPDQWFTSTSFKPLKETETDIGVFRKLLKPTKIKEDA